MLPFPVCKGDSEGKKKSGTETSTVQQLQRCDTGTYVSLQSPQDGFHN